MSNPDGPDEPDAEPDIQLPAEIRDELKASLEKIFSETPPDAAAREEAIEGLLGVMLGSVRSVTVQQISRHHSGPIPSPDTLAGYENIVPGAADRIIRMAEKEQDAFIAADKDKRRRDDRYRIIGLAGGLVSLAVIVGVTIYLAVNGHEGPAITVAGMGAAGIVAAFIQGNVISIGTSKE